MTTYCGREVDAKRLLTRAMVVGLACASMLAAGPSAWAVQRRHHHHHRRSVTTCGAGTVLSGRSCVPATSSPVGNGNVLVMPSDVTMTVDGLLVSSAAVSGLPPLTTVDSNSPIQCGPGGASIIIEPGGGIPVDALGRAQVAIRSGFTGEEGSGAGCVPGVYPLIFTESTTAPFQTFTGFITLHF